MRLAPCLRTPHSRLRLLDSPPAMAAVHQTGDHSQGQHFKLPAVLGRQERYAGCRAHCQHLGSFSAQSAIRETFNLHSDGQYLCEDSWISNQGQWLLVLGFSILVNERMEQAKTSRQVNVGVKFNPFCLSLASSEEYGVTYRSQGMPFSQPQKSVLSSFLACRNKAKAASACCCTSANGMSSLTCSRQQGGKEEKWADASSAEAHCGILTPAAACMV